MDNLTHSFVGAVLGRTGLSKKSGLGMAALVLGANAPDIDVFAPLLLNVQGISFHRGVTHGVGGWIVLPLALTALLIGYDRLQMWLGKRPERRLPVRPGWLFLLSAIGVLTHPLLDWTNTYGIKLLEPVSPQWFYGDALFIIDLWIWLAMGSVLILSLRREKQEREWRRPAQAVLAGVAAYIAANWMISQHAETLARQRLERLAIRPTMVVAQPVPVAFWRRTILWRDAEQFGDGDYVLGNGVRMAGTAQPLRLDDPRLTVLLRENPEARAFTQFARMPVVVTLNGVPVLADQRFFIGRSASYFSFPLER